MSEARARVGACAARAVRSARSVAPGRPRPRRPRPQRLRRSVGIHPGSAAVVGDESLSMSKIDDTTAALLPGLPAADQPVEHSAVPMRLLRQYVAASLTQRLLGEQLAGAVRRTAGLAVHPAGDQIEQPFAAAAPEPRGRRRRRGRRPLPPDRAGRDRREAARRGRPAAGRSRRRCSAARSPPRTGSRATRSASTRSSASRSTAASSSR